MTENILICIQQRLSCKISCPVLHPILLTTTKILHSFSITFPGNGVPYSIFLMFDKKIYLFWSKRIHNIYPLHLVWIYMPLCSRTSASFCPLISVQIIALVVGIAREQCHLRLIRAVSFLAAWIICPMRKSPLYLLSIRRLFDRIMNQASCNVIAHCTSGWRLS